MLNLYNIYKSIIMEDIEDDYKFDDYKVDDYGLDSIDGDYDSPDIDDEEDSDYDEVYGDKADGGEDDSGEDDSGQDYDDYHTGQYVKPLPPDEPAQTSPEKPINNMIGKTGGVSVDYIKKAIDDKYVIKITYDDGKSSATGDRWIEVVGYGLVKGTSNPVIRAYQLTGDSSSKKKGKKKGKFKGPWRLFRIDRIKSWEFGQKINNPEPNHGFNSTDDKSMSVVHKIAKY